MIPQRSEATRTRSFAPIIIAGGAFIALGIAVFVIGWDLPFGRISAPGAGMLPKLMAGFMILLAAGIFINGKSQEKFSDIPWSDWRHAALIIGISAIAVTALCQARLPDHHVASGVRAADHRRAQAPAPGRDLRHQASPSSPIGCSAIILKAPLEHGVLWF